MRILSIFALAALFIFAGFLHLVRPAPFAAIVPPLVPYHHAVVLISGLAEMAGGLGLLIPFTRKYASCGLALLLVAVFPANVYMAMYNIQVTAKPLPNSALWARLLLQPLLIWWVLWAGRAKRAS